MAEAGSGQGWRGWPSRPRSLPALGGVRTSVVGAVYVLLAAVTLAVVAGTIWALAVDGFYNAPAGSRWGFRTATMADGVVIGGVASGAAAAGLKQMDTVVAVAGARVGAHEGESAIASRLSRVRGPTLALTVRGEDGAVRTLKLPERGGVWWRADPQSHIVLWLFALATMLQPSPLLVAASLILFLRRPRDPEAMLLAFALLLVNYTPDLLWWTAAYGVSPTAVGHLGTIGWLLTFIGITGFPDGRFATRWARATVIGALLLEAAVLAARWRFDGVVPPGWQGVIARSSGLVGLAAGIAVILRFRQLPPGPERQQIKWAVGGIVAAMVMVAVFQPLDPADYLLSGNPWRFLLWQGAMLVMQGAMAAGLLISLLGYRLYDAEAALAKSLAYGALTLLLVGAFAASEKVVEILGDMALGPKLGAVSGVIGAALAAVLVGPLHGRVGRWAERRFQGRLIRLREGLPEVMEDLRETEALPAIGDAAAAAVVEAIRAEHAAVLAGEAVIGARGVAAAAVAQWRGGWEAPASAGLTCDAADPLFPVRVALIAGDDHGPPAGWLLLGARPDGSLPGRADRAALCDVAAPIARAIETVRRRDARERLHEQRIDTLEARLATALTALERTARGEAGGG